MSKNWYGRAFTFYSNLVKAQRSRGSKRSHDYGTNLFLRTDSHWMRGPPDKKMERVIQNFICHGEGEEDIIGTRIIEHVAEW